MADRNDLNVTQSTSRAFVVTPTDGVDLMRHTRGLYIGVAGTIRVTHVGDTDATDYPITIGGYIYPWAIKRVHATGTTATSIIAQI